MEPFCKYLTNIMPLSDKGLKAIMEKTKRCEYNKNYLLIPELAKCENLYFIEKGLVRAYYFKDGKEITDWFGLENMLFGPVVRNFPIKDSIHSVELLETSTFTYISFADLQQLYNEYHEIERLGRLIAIHTIILLQQKIDALQFLSAKERYQDFIKTYPSILKRASLGHIASYLGMNQVTLSRARKNQILA